MKIETAKSRIEVIQKRIKEEDKNVWEPCRKLYEGDRAGKPEDLHAVNLIWGTIRTLVPELFFNVPRFKLTAKHSSMTEDIRAKNEALLNAIIADKDMAFNHVIKNTILAAHLNLGVVTWGCNSEFMNHPMAGEAIPDSSGIYPDKIAKKDSYFIKRVRAQDFYPDLFSGETFEKLEYFAIAEFMTKRKIHDVYGVPLKKLKGGVSYLEVDERLRKRLQDQEEYETGKEKEEDYTPLRVYKMYNRGEGKVYTFINELDTFLDTEEYPKTEPVAILKFNDKIDEFWGIPEITQVEDSQLEIEVASTMRSEHMYRSGRKIGCRAGALTPEQIARLEDPSSHVVIELANKDDLWPIDFGTCDASIYSHEAISTEQFNQIMGVGASARGGAAPKRTATAEIIQDKKLNTRQMDKVKIVRDFLSRVGNGIKNCIDETLTLEREVEVLGDDGQPYIVQYIPGIDIHGDFDCTIDIAELAAPNEEVERNQWVGLLDIVGRSPLVFSNPVITKETLKRFGIDNKELVNAFVEIATRQMQMQAAQAGGGTGGIKGLPQGGLGEMMGATIAGGINAGG